MNSSKKSIKKKIKNGRGTIGEFKNFILKGNIIDLAVGVVIGGAFGKIITSLVNDILMPFVGLLMGGTDLTTLSFKVKDSVISYGNFIQNIVDFLIVAICIFVFIKVVARLTAKKKEEKVEDPKEDEMVVLLGEIRDLLKK